MPLHTSPHTDWGSPGSTSSSPLSNPQTLRPGSNEGSPAARWSSLNTKQIIFQDTSSSINSIEIKPESITKYLVFEIAPPIKFPDTALVNYMSCLIIGTLAQEHGIPEKKNLLILDFGEIATDSGKTCILLQSQVKCTFIQKKSKKINSNFPTIAFVWKFFLSSSSFRSSVSYQHLQTTPHPLPLF